MGLGLSALIITAYGTYKFEKDLCETEYREIFFLLGMKLKNLRYL